MQLSSIEPGQDVGRYRIVREFGAGGMGVVFEAEDRALGRRVALKVLPEALTHDEERRQRMVREARAAAAVQHESIAVVHEVGEDRGRIFIAMELIQGETLEAMIARGPLTPARVVDIGLQMARALDKAHRSDVLHRDLKPANIMVNEEGRVKLLDFGLAKRSADGETPAENAETVSVLTQEGRVMGTPGYMAPEQAEGLEVDERADVFALGTILYEMLTGKMAFGGKSSAERIASTLKVEPPPLARTKGVPTVLVDAVSACLSKQPAARLPSAGHVVAALVATQGALESEGGSRRRDVLLGAAAALGVGVVIALGVQARSGIDNAPLPPTSSAKSATRERLTDAKLACPLFSVTGQIGPAGRLGAAAASTTCSHLEAMLRRDAVTMRPAHLMALPKMPVDDFPAAPYAAADARARSIAAAKRDADIWVDGDVAVKDRLFVVGVRLVSGDKPLTERFESQDAIVDIAARSALMMLGAARGIEADSPADPSTTAISGCATLGCLTQVSNLQERIASEVDLEASCQALAQLSPPIAGGRARACGRYETSDEGMPLWPPTLMSAVDCLPSAAQHYWHALLALQSLTPERAGAAADQLARDRAAISEDTDLKRHLIVGEATLRYRAGDAQQSHALLDRAYQARPTNCSARIVAGDLGWALGAHTSLARAGSGWCPSNAHAWEFRYSAERGPTQDVEWMRTAFYIRAGSVRTGVGLGESLLIAGRPDEARLLASRFLSGHKHEHLAGNYLQARVDLAEGRIKGALDRLDKAFASVQTFGAWRDRRVHWSMMFSALSLGVVEGRARQTADRVLTKFLLTDPPAVGRTPPIRWAYVATFASRPVGLKAIERLRQLVKDGVLWTMEAADAYLAGSEAMIRGDFGAAATAWRPLVSMKGYLPALRAEVFDRAGEPAIGSEIDSAIVEMGGAVVGLSLVREAERAEARGDGETARKLAEKIVAAWAKADVKIEEVARMRAILSRHAPSPPRPTL